MRTLLWLVTWCTLALLWPLRLMAQADAPLVTDRPDQTESTAIVPRGRGQLEFGSAFANESSDVEKAGSLTLLSALLRVGVLGRLEARLGFLGWTRQTGSAGPDQAESGFGSFELGAKYRLRDGDGLDPSVALLGGAVIPSGSSGVRAERVDPSFRIAAAHELGERVGVGYNLGVRGVSIRHGDGVVATEAEGIYTASVGVGLTDWLAVFGEAFGALALSSRAVEAHLVDAGVTLLLRHNLQLDFSGGKGYAGAAENWFVSAGVSIRLPR